MAEREKKAADVIEEVEQPDGNTGVTEAEEFNQHIKNLVALYSDQILRELEQRISDLEMVVGQPVGAVEFRTADAAPTGDGVQWYQSPGGV